MVVCIQHGLVIHRRVDGSDRPRFNTDSLVQSLNDRHNRIGGTGRVRHNTLARMQLFMVNPKNHGFIHVNLCRLREQNFFRTAIKMKLCRGSIRECATALQHHVHSKVSPGQSLRILVIQQCNDVITHEQTALIAFQRQRKPAMGRIIAGKVQDGARIGEFVDGDNLHIFAGRALIEGAQDAAPNSAVAVNPQAQHRMMSYKRSLTTATTFSGVNPK